MSEITPYVKVLAHLVYMNLPQTPEHVKNGTGVENPLEVLERLEKVGLVMQSHLGFTITEKGDDRLSRAINSFFYDRSPEFHGDKKGFLGYAAD